MFTHSIIKKTNYGFQKHAVIAYTTCHSIRYWTNYTHAKKNAPNVHSSDENELPL